MYDLNAVAIFVSVVEAGSFTGGARALGLPKGSVSRKISGLETVLGVRLLNRTTRKLSLTDFGRTFHEHCRRGLAEIDTARRLADETQAAPRGVLRISAPADFGGGGLADWIDAFLIRYREVSVELVLSDRYVDLIEQRIDVAIRTGRLRDSSFVARKLGPAARIVCASPDYLDRRGTPQIPDDLRNHDGIVFGPSISEAVWHLYGPDGDVAVPVAGRVAADSMGFVLRAALSGHGIAMIPRAIAGAYLEDGRLRHILQPYMTRSQGVFAVYPSSRQVSPTVRAFIDLVVEMSEHSAPWSIARG